MRNVSIFGTELLKKELHDEARCNKGINELQKYASDD